MYRQGDVLLIPVDKVPQEAGLFDAEQEDGRLILARGEMTGHHHSVDSKHTVMYGGATQRFLKVEEPTTLKHQEHDPIDLNRGVYEVRLQKQHHPKIEYRQDVD